MALPSASSEPARLMARSIGGSSVAAAGGASFITDNNNQSSQIASPNVMGTHHNFSDNHPAMMGIGDDVRRERKARGWSQAELGKRIGISQVAIRKIEGGSSKKSKYLAEILDMLGLPQTHKPPTVGDRAYAAFTKGENSLVGERNLPVFASAEAGGGAMVISSDPVDYVRRPQPLENVKDGYALIVVGESMTPRYEPGDMLLVHPHLPPVPGCDVVLYSDDGAGQVLVTVKRLRKATAEAWHLHQHNPPAGRKADFVLSRKDWQKCHRVVGCYSRR